MNAIDDFNELFDQKFSDMWIDFMIDDDDPLSDTFENHAMEMVSC